MPILIKLPKSIAYILCLYFWGMLFFLVFRVLLFIQGYDNILSLASESSTSLTLQAFWMGLRFDTVISGYLLALPFLLLSIHFIFRFEQKGLYHFVFLFTSIAYCLAFLVCAIDVPYFNQFFSRFSVAAFNWVDSPVFVGKMVAQNFKTWWTIIPFLMCSVLFYQKNKNALHKILLKESSNPSHTKNHYLKAIGSFLIFGGLIFLAIRGRTTFKSPIRVGTAYFSNDPFLNQLGLNPNFTLFRSIIDAKDDKQKEVSFMDEQLALQKVKGYLNIPESSGSTSPLAREVTFSGQKTSKQNVVIVLMESMSAAKMGAFGNPHQLTPFLDSLALESYFFNDFYSAGIHTFSGIFATLTSLPTVKRQHPLKEGFMHKYDGIAPTLKRHNYQTIYFTTHDEQFDNVGGFLKVNDFDQIIAQKDYPTSKVESTLGVPDDFMFEFSVPYLNKINHAGNPFLAVYMTASDHTPFVVPDYFKPKNKEDKLQIVEYADWALEKFLTLCAKEAWFDNTIFVFLADHGVPIDVQYELPLNYHHIPLIIHAQKFIQPRTIHTLGNQIDLFPTLMGILELPYQNNTLGIDLLREKRPYTFFNSNDKYGVLSQSHFFIQKESGEKHLYERGEKNDIYEQYKPKADSMDVYTRSMFQAAQVLMK